MGAWGGGIPEIGYSLTTRAQKTRGRWKKPPDCGDPFGAMRKLRPRGGIQISRFQGKTANPPVALQSGTSRGGRLRAAPQPPIFYSVFGRGPAQDSRQERRERRRRKIAPPPPLVRAICLAAEIQTKSDFKIPLSPGAESPSFWANRIGIIRCPVGWWRRSPHIDVHNRGAAESC